MSEHLTKDEAIKFFSKLFRGEHHIPGKGDANKKVSDWGYGWCVNYSGDLATYDFNMLTRFVVLCHDNLYRGSVEPSNPRHLKLVIFKRFSEGEVSKSHPYLEQHAEDIRKSWL